MELERKKEIKHYHEFIPKTERPIEGKTYLLTMNDVPTYIANITDFNGGCWAKVKVVESANEEYADLYYNGMEFEIKVAHYGFHEVSN